MRWTMERIESHLVPAAPEDRDGANVADLDDAAISLSKRW